MNFGSGMKIVVNKSANIGKAVGALAGTRTMVGWPDSTAERQQAPGETEAPPTNATIAYLMEYGSPASNVPARPALIPGIKKYQDRALMRLRSAGIAAFDGKMSEVDRQFESMGLEAADVVRGVITAGIPPPLADSTLRARLRDYPSRVAEKAELASRAAGNPPGMDNVTPRISTGQNLAGVTHIVRKVR